MLSNVSVIENTTIVGQMPCIHSVMAHVRRGYSVIETILCCCDIYTRIATEPPLFGGILVATVWKSAPALHIGASFYRLSGCYMKDAR